MNKKNEFYYAHLGNGVSIWRPGAENYCAHISVDRILTYKKGFEFSEKDRAILAFMRDTIEVSVSHTQLEMVLTPPPILDDPGMGRAIGHDKILYRSKIYTFNGKNWTLDA